MLSIYCKYAKIPRTEIPEKYQKIPEKIPGKYQKPKKQEKNRLQTATVYIEKYQKNTNKNTKNKSHKQSKRSKVSRVICYLTHTHTLSYTHTSTSTLSLPLALSICLSHSHTHMKAPIKLLAHAHIDNRGELFWQQQKQSKLSRQEKRITKIYQKKYQNAKKYQAASFSLCLNNQEKPNKKPSYQIASLSLSLPLSLSL